MRILVVIKNVYSSNGGGEFFYRRIAELNPKIKYFYFKDLNVTNSFPTPPNVIEIKIPPEYELVSDWSHLLKFAGGGSFDIVESPDFNALGFSLILLLNRFKIQFKKISVSCHGIISKSLENNWTIKQRDEMSNKELILNIKSNEMSTFKHSDFVYGISPKYTNYLRSEFDLKHVYTFNPLTLYNSLDLEFSYQHYKSSSTNIFLPGRYETRKGIDIVVNALKYLSNSDNYKIVITDARYIDILKLYDFEYEVFNYKSTRELANLYSKVDKVIIASKFDSFNLLALESLLLGVIPLTTTDTWATSFLKLYSQSEFLGGLDLKNRREWVNVISRYLAHPTLVANSGISKDILNQKNDLLPLDQLTENYSKLLGYELNSNLNSSVEAGQPGSSIKIKFKISILDNFVKSIRYLSDRCRYFKKIRLAVKNLLRDYFYSFFFVLASKRLLFNVLRDGETLSSSNSQIESSLIQHFSGFLSRNNFGVNRVLENLSKINVRIGNISLAVCYSLRIIRYSNQMEIRNSLVDLIESQKELPPSIEGVKILLSVDGKESYLNYLNNRFEQLKLQPVLPNFEVLLRLDHEITKPNVSIIVSLYNAENQLPFFIHQLLQLEEVKSGLVEIIFVECGSTTSDFRVSDSLLRKSNVNFRYLRTSERETIQMAWNIGILNSETEFLSFLGTDEMLLPGAINKLFGELKNNPKVDWVIGDSLIVEVDSQGDFQSNVMRYWRKDLTKFDVLLETCYLSWVGAMYRKNIHSKYGYYDPSFSAAGDTEFKNRILPFIEIRHLDSLLGIFQNYPSPRTTQSSKAEVEDALAWYPFRTSGGFDYFFQHSNYNQDDLDTILMKCLHYRKSFCQHFSSDFSLALAVVNSTSFDSKNLKRKMIKTLINLHHKYLNDYSDGFISSNVSPLILFLKLALTSYITEYLVFGRLISLGYKSRMEKIFCDNRFEQHWTKWDF